MRRAGQFLLVLCLMPLAFGTVVGAAEIKVFTTRSVMTILEKVGPEFQRTTAHTLHVTSDIAINLVRRIDPIASMSS